eukprot:6573585-Pyramimonas_sp.AAC.1
MEHAFLSKSSQPEPSNLPSLARAMQNSPGPLSASGWPAASAFLPPFMRPRIVAMACRHGQSSSR